ncbi:hypothetical protein Patl1_08178 [Pistacia atlantica]|uniref:Uncharacterized protein n=1 Tax=Pistacia atlantica TaxID=434234 RepID=A0ACC1AKS4_9ROSI|nr:hypothetical protein Patl1_08178 [Pistacia atlantica]
MATIMAVIPMPLGYNVKSNTSSATLRSNISRNRKSAYPTKLGFHAGFISGYALSGTLLGKPDFGLITSPEIAAATRIVCAGAPMIPIIVDAETGGGSALNVQRTIKELIAAGAAGCCIEDTRLGNRTDARVTSGKKGLSDAIARANLYVEAGADASFVEAPRDDKELEEIGRKTKGYRVCDMYEGGVTPLHTPEEVKAMGFHLIVHPLSTFYASARALLDVLSR